MIKNLYLKITIVFIVLSSMLIISTALSNDKNIFAINETTSNEQVINSATNYNFIDKPSNLTGNSNKFYVTNNKGELYSYSNNTLTKTNHLFNNLIDIIYSLVLNKIIAIDGNQIIEINAVDNSVVSTNTLENAKCLAFNEVYFCIGINNSISIKFDGKEYVISDYYIDNYNTSNFHNIKDICIYNNELYVLDANALTSRVNLIKIKIQDDLTQSKAQQINQISVNTKNDFSITPFDNGLIIKEETILKLFDFKGNFISNLLKEYTNFDRSFKSGEVVQCSSVLVDTNKIIIADKFSNSIQSFIIENNELKFSKLLIASYGSDIDRLYNASTLASLNETQLIICDYGNKRLITNTLDSKIKEIPINGNPNNITISNNKSFYVYARPNICYFEDMDSKPIIKEIGNFNIIDMQISTLNNLYLLDTKTKSLLSLIDNNTTKTIASINEIDNNSKLNIDATGKFAYILAQNKIYLIDLENNSVKNVITNENQVIDFVIDYKGNIYLLIKNSSNVLELQKYENYILKTSNTLQGKNYINLELNLNTGEFYTIDNKLSTIIKINFDAFTDNLLSFKNDTSFINAPTSNEKVLVAKFTKSASAYKYPFMISPIMQFNKDEQIIVLKKECEENPKFSYCLISNKEDKNVLGYISNDCLNFNIEDEKPEFKQIKIITAYAYIYKLPTSLSFADNTNLKLDRIANQNELFNVVGYANNYKDNTNSTFYCVQLEDNTYGYIKTYNAMNSTLDVYQKTFQSNAHLEKVLENDEIEIFNKNNDKYLGTNTYLKDKTKIFIQKEDYKVDNDYTKIVYQNENNEQISCYVLTKYVVPETITQHIQIGIILLIVSIILITIIAIYITKFIKQRKIKDNLNSIEKNNN